LFGALGTLEQLERDYNFIILLLVMVDEQRFNGVGYRNHLLAAGEVKRSRCGAITPAAPVEFLEPYEQRLLVDASGKFRVSLYKAVLFIKIAEAIKAGTLNLGSVPQLP